MGRREDIHEPIWKADGLCSVCGEQGVEEGGGE